MQLSIAEKYFKTQGNKSWTVSRIEIELVSSHAFRTILQTVYAFVLIVRTDEEGLIST